MVRRIFRSGKPSGSPSNSVSPQGGVAPNAGTPTALASLRHIFRRSNQGSIAAQTADTGASGGSQQQREQTQATPTQDTQMPTHNSETVPMPAAHDVGTVVGPFGDTSDGAVDPTSTTLSPASALVGSEVDAAQQALDRMAPISGAGHL
ncbi:hypothetical protein BKA82DRAFT_4341827, partial [Pisolithus tinctorius]